jgi:hypothetical protein
MVFAPHWLVPSAALRSTCSQSQLPRYDLRVLFDKAHGEFSVNVQAISRVRRVYLPVSAVPFFDMPLIGREPTEDFSLGT